MNETEKTVVQLIGELPKDYSRPSNDEINDFRTYISSFTWTNAKTFEDSHLINIS